MSHSDHRRSVQASVALLTISDSRTLDDDRSGDVARRLLEEQGHRIHQRALLPDEPEQVRAQVLEWLSQAGCDAVITSGGTGISGRDRTYEALADLLDQRLDGFGELFRQLSFREIGPAAMLSRAVGGIAAAKPLFLLPGSPNAVSLALTGLILPELGHLLGELRRGGAATS